MRSISCALGVIERPACNTERRLYLIGVTAAPERDADTLVEHPTHGQMDHPPVKTALCELIELPHGLEILRPIGAAGIWGRCAADRRHRKWYPAECARSATLGIAHHSQASRCRWPDSRAGYPPQWRARRGYRAAAARAAEPLGGSAPSGRPKNCSRRWRGSFPARRSERIASAVSSTGTRGSGQWTW
jgi:hypothetical protein